MTSFINKSHLTIPSEVRGRVPNLVTGESDSARITIADIAIRDEPQNLLDALKMIKILDPPLYHYLGVDVLHPDSLSKIY